MRGLCVVLLSVLLCSDHALSLQCYLCTGTQATTQCLTGTCGQGQKVCYKANLVVTVSNSGEKINTVQGGCAPSCEETSKLMQTMTDQTAGLGLLGPKFEVQGVSCCEKNLCNGVSRAGRSLWALGGGLLLSLGPALLWTLL